MDLWLPDVRLAQISPRLIDATGRFMSPLNGAVRTVTRPGDRWGFRLNWQSITDADRGRMESVLTQQRGAANRVLISPQDYKQRGSLPLGEFVPNSSFLGSSTWTASGAAFTVTDQIARVANSGAASGRITSPLITLTVGLTYVVRVCALPGNQAAWKVNGGTSAGASDVFSVVPPALDQIAIVGFTATSANFYLSLLCNTAVAGDFVYFSYASLTRGALVKGANQTGSALNIDGLPTSTDRLLVAGDWVGIGVELKRVTGAMSSDGSGNGYLQFSPPLRASPADNSGIVVTDPLGRFIASSNENGWDVVPGKFSTMAIDFIEAP